MSPKHVWVVLVFFCHSFHSYFGTGVHQLSRNRHLVAEEAWAWVPCVRRRLTRRDIDIGEDAEGEDSDSTTTLTPIDDTTTIIPPIVTTQRPVVDLTEPIRRVEQELVILRSNLAAMNQSLSHAIKLTKDEFAMTVSRINQTMFYQMQQLEQKLTANMDGQISVLKQNVSNVENSLKSEILRVESIAQRPASTVAPANSELWKAVRTTSRQLKALEEGKVQKLLNHNELWKRNFRVINATLHRLNKNVG